MERNGYIKSVYPIPFALSENSGVGGGREIWKRTFPHVQWPDNVSLEVSDDIGGEEDWTWGEKEDTPSHVAIPPSMVDSTFLWDEIFRIDAEGSVNVPVATPHSMRPDSVEDEIPCLRRWNI